jgi:FkbM family methyltransferase
MKKLEALEKQNVSYCIPLSLRDEQIRINLDKVKGRLEPYPDLINEPIALVCFAPSLKQTWEELKNFKYILTCSGAHKFLVERGIIPTHHIDLDPRIHKLKLLGQPQKETQYLIASTIHPKYLDQLEGYNVKLWHIFANEDDGARVLPREEWMITGGSSVGLRCFNIARFLGFTNMHVFGMDGSFTSEGTHTAEHPNAPKESYETEYNGRTFLTTPSMLHVAQETFYEMDQMPDCTFKFYGDGLVQEMAKLYKPAHAKGKSMIAIHKPALISKEYVVLNSKLHKDIPEYGMGGSKHKDVVIKLSESLKTTSILDYGAGKQMLAKSLPFPIWSYDPAIPEIAAPPKPADIVICTDVLEHIEPDKLQFVLDDLRFCTKKIGYFVISTRPAVKKYSNGENAHLIIKGKAWWENMLKKYFDIGRIIEKENELHIVVAPKTVPQPDMEIIEKDGRTFKFLTPNETTKWRAKSLFTKEPSTVEWINSMQAGEILYDVGANIGSYSILAGVKGITVYSFEPEAENYLLLVKNMMLNNLSPNAYCIALSNEEKAGMLYASSHEAGAACHSFNEMVGHNLAVRQTPFTQGCFGVPLDTLVDRGLPVPQYIKIDVDGFEFKVVQGAKRTLQNGVKSILIEVNTELPQHREMITYLESIGFTYSPEQVEKAKRKDGTFKGVAEYVFTKSAIELHSPEAKRIADTKISKSPYPYVYVKDFFKESFYKDILANMPDKYEEIEKTRGTKGYPKRFTASIPNNDAWNAVKNNLLSGEFKQSLLDKFGIKDDNFTEDLVLVRDFEGYQIPPHTDSTAKVITALIYLPKADEFVDEGTSIFVPNKKGFTCKTGKHYDFKDFTKKKTMPFKPNSAFIFARTDNSFHGVEPSKHVRDVLLYNIKRK